MKKIITLITIIVALMFMCSCVKAPKMSDSKPGPSAENNTVETATLITEEEAKEIALEKAELTQDDVAFDRIELDFDDGVWMYEIEFIHGTTEYEIELCADNGEILKWEKDSIY